MNTLTINLIHPKAEKLIYDLVEMNLISIESQNIIIIWKKTNKNKNLFF